MYRSVLLGSSLLVLSAVGAGAGFTTHALNLRAGPGTSYGVVAAMPRGAQVDVGRCFRGWCAVSYRGRKGYASARYIDLRGQGVFTGQAPSNQRPGFSYPYSGYRYSLRPGTTPGTWGVFGFGPGWRLRYW